MVSGLKRPMHQKSHKKKINLEMIAQKRKKKQWSTEPNRQYHYRQNKQQGQKANESFNESIKITQITTTQTSQPQKRETSQAQQTHDSCNGTSLSKYTQLARVTGTRLDPYKFTIYKQLNAETASV